MWHNENNNTGIFKQPEQYLKLLFDLYQGSERYIERVNIDGSNLFIKTHNINEIRYLQEIFGSGSNFHYSEHFDRYYDLQNKKGIDILQEFIEEFMDDPEYGRINGILKMGALIRAVLAPTEEGVSVSGDANLPECGPAQYWFVKAYYLILKNALSPIQKLAEVFISGDKVKDAGGIDSGEVKYISLEDTGQYCKITINCDLLLKLLAEELRVLYVNISIPDFLQSIQGMCNVPIPNLFITPDNKIYIVNYKEEHKVSIHLPLYIFCLDISLSMNDITGQMEQYMDIVVTSISQLIDENKRLYIENYKLQLLFFNSMLARIDIEVIENNIFCIIKSCKEETSLSVLLELIKKEMVASGDTALYEAISTSFTNINEHIGNLKKVVLITDGQNTIYDMTKEELYEKIGNLDLRDCDSYFIGIGFNADKKFLSDIAKKIGGHYSEDKPIKDIVKSEQRNAFEVFNLLLGYLNKPATLFEVWQEGETVLKQNLYNGNILYVDDIVDTTKEVVIINWGENKRIVISPDRTVQELDLA